MQCTGRARLALIVVAGAASLGVTACQGTKKAPPVYACDVQAQASPEASASSPPPPDPALTPDAAGEIAKEEFATAESLLPDGRVPLVTVEETGGAPEITSTPVGSPEEGKAVAEQAAADGDLVAVEADSIVTADALDDPLLDEQYAFQRIAYEQTWNAFANGLTGVGAGAGQRVAVLDTGVQANHKDLDDGRVLTGAAFGQPGPATNDPSGHGTRIAGIVAAETDNGVGIAGAAPAAKILPVKVLNSSGEGLSSEVAHGITWAADNGATVINLSLGGPNPSQAMQQAVRYAVHTRGVPVISSSGNSGKCGQASYPGAFPEVLAVGATDQGNNWASFSTTGPFVSLSAPGVAIISTTRPGPDTYGLGSGTSFSAPYVAAAAAIVRSTHSGWGAGQTYVQLIETATDLGSQGWDPHFGSGLVNVFAAATTG
jgi:subtilisin family serine protease